MPDAKKEEPFDYPGTVRGLNNFTADRNFARYLERVYPGMLKRQRGALTSLGAFAGGRLDKQAADSVFAQPSLRDDLERAATDRKRINRVRLDPEYKDCQQEMYRHGIIARLFDPKNPEPHAFAFAAQYLVSFSDISTGCPLAMTHPNALVLAARAPDSVRDKFLPQFLRTDGFTMIGGTWGTEEKGGSDLRGNTETLAVLLDPQTGRCVIDGKNFFTSAMGFDSWGAIKTVQMGPPGSEDIALVFITRFNDEDWDKPESQRHLNNVFVTRLKEKSGTLGLATAEIEMDGAIGYLIAGPAEGLRIFMEGLGVSRIHNAMAATAVMHRAYAEAVSWAANRRAFGHALIEYEDMQEDILRLRTEWHGGAALAFENVRSFDEALHDKSARPWLRVITALAKYQTAEQAVLSTGLARQIVGGNGATSDHPINRIHNDAEILRLWEGGKNIQARELMHVLRRGGDKTFLQRFDDIIELMPRDPADTARNRLIGLRTEMFGALTALPQDAENDGLIGQRYLKAMATALTYALLCEEAEHERRLYNDNTKQLTADAFYEEHYRTEIKPSLEKTALHEHFNEVVRGEPVSPAPKKPAAPGRPHVIHELGDPVL